MERVAGRKRNAPYRLLLFIGLVSACIVVSFLSENLSGKSRFLHEHLFPPIYVPVKPLRITYQRPSEAATAEESFRPLITATNNGSICILAFSAHFDEAFKTVKILTDVDKACNNITSINTLCLIWYRDRADPYTATLRFNYFATRHTYRRPRVGAIYGCDSHPNITGSPYAVSVVANNTDETASNVMTIHLSSYSSMAPTITFAVCTPPLFGKIRPQAIAEFIEIHLLLGAELFYFYNASSPPSVGKLLASYVADGIVKIIQFQSVYPNKVFYNNQGIMQLDCMYRNRGKARYVAQMDVDEILMPRENYANWTLLTRSKFERNSAALIFLNKFFTSDTSSQCSAHNESSLPDGMPSSLKRLWYYDEDHPSGDRSKFIYSPERVKFVGTHYVEPMNGYAPVVLSTRDEGMLHHYRSQLPTSSPTPNVTIVNHRACNFSDLLLKQLIARLSLI